MADQTVKIERDDVAATAKALAWDLWVNETGQEPKASDAKFIRLLGLYTLVLSNKTNSDGAQRHIEQLFQ